MHILLCMLKSQSVYFLPLLLTSDHLEKQTIKFSLFSNRMIYICESFEKDLLVGLELELMTLLLVVIKFLGPNFFSLLAIPPPTHLVISGAFIKSMRCFCASVFVAQTSFVNLLMMILLAAFI